MALLNAYAACCRGQRLRRRRPGPVLLPLDAGAVAAAVRNHAGHGANSHAARQSQVRIQLLLCITDYRNQTYVPLFGTMLRDKDRC